MGCFIVQVLTKRIFSLLLSFIVVVFCFGVGVASAGSFKVFPLKLELGSKTKTALFKITNTGDTPVTVQLETVNWFQNSDGDDKYESTRDIVYFPKIVKVKAGQQRIIRVGYRGEKLASKEKTYRIFAQELPELGDKKGALKFSLRFSVPIFVNVAGTESKAKIASAELNNGQLKVFVKNAGSEHFVVKKIKANGVGFDGQQVFSTKTGGWYVLPGANKPFLVNLPENECRLSEKILYTVETSAGSYSKSIPVDSGQCVMIPDMNKVNTLSFEQ